MKGSDVVLIKPGSQKRLYGELSENSLTAIEPPLWAGLLATFLRRRGHSVMIIDAEADHLTPSAALDMASAASPLLVGVIVSGTNPSASTMNMVGAREILEEASRRRPRFKTIVAGLHPSALPERTMREEKTDFVCEGEGFYTFTGLIETLKGDYEKRDFDIKGLWYRRDGEVVANERAPLLKDIDRELPDASWDLMPPGKYRAHNWHCFQEPGQKREPYGVVFTSLGCPFRCDFCCINAIFGRPGIRLRSPERVVDEMGLLVDMYGVRNIKIIDEMFVLNERHVQDICDLIISRGYDLNIWAYARINTVTERLLGRLKEAGFNWLGYGIESGNDSVLESVGKGITVEKTKEVVALTRGMGINVGANYIFGLPEDNLESMTDTLDLALELNCEFANMYCATAYPGSRLYDRAVREGWELPESWAAYSPYAYDHLPLRTRHLSATEVLRFRDEAYVRYYTNPGYQRMIMEKFGPEVLNGIREGMTKRVKRRYLEGADTHAAAR